MNNFQMQWSHLLESFNPYVVSIIHNFLIAAKALYWLVSEIMKEVAIMLHMRKDLQSSLNRLSFTFIQFVSSSHSWPLRFNIKPK